MGRALSRITTDPGYSSWLFTIDLSYNFCYFIIRTLFYNSQFPHVSNGGNTSSVLLPKEVDRSSAWRRLCEPRKTASHGWTLVSSHSLWGRGLLIPTSLCAFCGRGVSVSSPRLVSGVSPCSADPLADSGWSWVVQTALEAGLDCHQDSGLRTDLNQRQALTFYLQSFYYCILMGEIGKSLNG